MSEGYLNLGWVCLKFGCLEEVLGYFDIIINLDFKFF